MIADRARAVMIVECSAFYCTLTTSGCLPADAGCADRVHPRLRHAPQDFRGSGTATITGVGFFDFQHGQTGVAPNAIEPAPCSASRHAHDGSCGVSSEVRYAASTCSSPTNADSSSSSNGTTSRTRKRSAAGDELLVGVDHLSVGRLTEIVPVGRVEPVPEHVSSVPGSDGASTITHSGHTASHFGGDPE